MHWHVNEVLTKTQYAWLKSKPYWERAIAEEWCAYAGVLNIRSKRNSYYHWIVVECNDLMCIVEGLE